MRLIATTLLLAFALPAQAEVLCPDSIDVSQQASVPTADWTVAYTDPPVRLTGVTIYDGPPSQNRKISPVPMKSAKGELRMAWRLPQSRRNFYLRCSYERTTASLNTILPPGVTGCNAVFDRRVSYGNQALAVKRMVCN